MNFYRVLNNSLNKKNMKIIKKIITIIIGTAVFLFSGCVDSEKNIQNSEIQETQKAEITQISTSVSAKQFKSFTSKITKHDLNNVILDVRTLPEFQSGHIKNAQMIDFYKVDFREKLSVLDKNKKYFIYCRSGDRSGKTLKIMKKLGFANVYNLKFGINDWNRNKYLLVL